MSTDVAKFVIREMSHGEFREKDKKGKRGKKETFRRYLVLGMIVTDEPFELMVDSSKGDVVVEGDASLFFRDAIQSLRARKPNIETRGYNANLIVTSLIEV